MVEKESGKKMPHVNGGQVVRFPQKTATNEIVACECIRTSIQLSLENPDAEREITSLLCNRSGYIGIRFYHSGFPNGIEAIKSKLEGEFGLEIKFRTGPGRTSKDYMRFTSISW